MSLLYVANCTRQVKIIWYRLEFDKQGQMKKTARPRRSPPIKSGQQIAIHGQMTDDEKKSMIDQLANYGLIAESDINNSMPNRLVPYVYSEDIPVKSQSIYAVANHNRGILHSEGRERRQNAAVSAAVAAESETAKDMAAGPMRGFEMSVEQEDEPTERDQSRLSEAFHFKQNLDEIPKDQRRPKRNRN